MRIKLDTYEYVRQLKEGKEFELPDETTYWFETGIRRAIRIIPVWTTWNVKQYSKPEEIREYNITCVYGSWECKIETYNVSVGRIAEIYNNEKSDHVIKSLLLKWLDSRTKEQFEADLNSALKKINNFE